MVMVVIFSLPPPFVMILVIMVAQVLRKKFTVAN